MNDFVGIDICEMDETDPNSRVLMTYATEPTNLQKMAIVRRVFPHYLTVQVTADNLAEPERKSFKIHISDDGYLRVDTIRREEIP